MIMSAFLLWGNAFCFDIFIRPTDAPMALKEECAYEKEYDEKMVRDNNVPVPFR